MLLLQTAIVFSAWTHNLVVICPITKKKHDIKREKNYFNHITAILMSLVGKICWSCMEKVEGKTMNTCGMYMSVFFINRILVHSVESAVREKFPLLIRQYWLWRDEFKLPYHSHFDEFSGEQKHRKNNNKHCYAIFSLSKWLWNVFFSISYHSQLWRAKSCIENHPLYIKS